MKCYFNSGITSIDEKSVLKFRDIFEAITLENVSLDQTIDDVFFGVADIVRISLTASAIPIYRNRHRIYRYWVELHPGLNRRKVSVFLLERVIFSPVLFGCFDNFVQVGELPDKLYRTFQRQEFIFEIEGVSQASHAVK